MLMCPASALVKISRLLKVSAGIRPCPVGAGFAVSRSSGASMAASVPTGRQHWQWQMYARMAH
jgi:hypothetical protein